MRNRLRRGIYISLAFAAFALLVITLMVVLPNIQGTSIQRDSTGFGLSVFLAVTSALIGLMALWHAIGLVTIHFRALGRLRGAVVTLAGDPSAVLPLPPPGEAGAEIERLHGALADLAAGYAEERAIPDLRLSAVLASITEAMVVITDQGQVSLVNFAAKSLLGVERVRVGTSVFAALMRDPVVTAIEKAQHVGQPIDAELTTVDGETLAAKVTSLDEYGGAVLLFRDGEWEHRQELEHDLNLHDRPPETSTVTEDTPLHDLPVLVMDTETTGLDPARDRIVAIGAVHLHGARVYRSVAFDRLVQPGIPIPPRSTAVHGITDAMVADADHFPHVFALFAGMMAGVVIVGHNIPFDIAMLRRECEIAGIPWQDPLFLDTLHLAAALDPSLPNYNLEDLADHFGVDVHGRHTALGDSLVTAELYQRMLPRLIDIGVTTFGDARRFSQKNAKAIIEQQKRAGW